MRRLEPPQLHTRTASISTAVVEAIAEYEGVDPLELSRPLYEVIDPDALDNLFPPGSNSAGQIEFSYNGCAVTVTSDGDVDVVNSDAA